MYVTADVNQKGGVGKTATAKDVAAALAAAGRRVLAVDFDPQGHLSSALQISPAPDERSLAAAMTGGGTDPQVVTVVEYPTGGRLDLVPTSWAMFTLTRELDQLRAREYRLARVLQAFSGHYDHAVLDCPPALDVITDNALTASDGLLIPVQAEDSTLRALQLLMAQVDAVEQDLRSAPLEVMGLVLSLLRRPPSLLARSVIEQLENLDGMPLLATVPLGVVVTEAWRSGQAVIDYAPDSEHAHAYRSLASAVDKAAA